MKILGRITAGLILIAVPMFAHAETVNVEVNNIRVSKGGNVMVLLFTGEGFPIKHDQAEALHTKPANAERLDFKFKNPIGNCYKTTGNCCRARKDSRVISV